MTAPALKPSDCWLTPSWMIDALVGAGGAFETDPASPMPGSAPNMTWRTAKVCYSPVEDGLAQRWQGDVLLNSPYSTGLIGRFMKRMAEHDQGVAIVNVATDTVWFTRYVWQPAAAVLFLYQRVKFIQPAGPIGRNHYRYATALVAYGARNVDRLADCGIPGAFIPLPGSCQIVAVYRPGSGISWAALLVKIVERQGGELDLTLAYALVRHHPKASANQNWKPKVRQVLQGPAFERIAPATYRLKGAAA